MVMLFGRFVSLAEYFCVFIKLSCDRRHRNEFENRLSSMFACLGHHDHAYVHPHTFASECQAVCKMP